MGFWQQLRERLAHRLRHRERHELVERVEDLFRGWWVLRLLAALAAVAVGLGLLVAAPALGVGLLVLGVSSAFLGGVQRLMLLARRPRAAAVVAWIDDARWGRDRSGGYTATLALAERQGLSDATPALDQRLADVDRVTAGVALAAGLRALGEGREADARLLLELVREFDRSVRPPTAQRCATEALMASCAARGRLTGILELGRHPRAARTPLAHLLVLVARRASGEPVPDVALRVAAQLATPFGAAQPVLERALRLPRGARRPAAHPDPVVALGRVGPGPRRSELVALAGRLEEHLFAAERVEAWRGRAAVLGARVDPVAAARGVVVARLAELLAGAVQDLPDPDPAPPCWREAVERLVSARQDELAALADELARRTRSRWALPLVEEALASLRVERAYQAVVAADPRHGIAAHLKCWGPLVNHTVWLHNDRGQATLANALYRVQLRRAESVGHAPAIELMTKNLGCGP